MNHDYFLKQLYPFQDRVLSIINNLETGFYLSGGTALSRGYINHRFSDDLDLFVNDDDRFGLWAEQIIARLNSSSSWQTQVLLRDDRFVRLNLPTPEINLKIELINDVPVRVGEPWLHPILGKIDTAENILANKITAVLVRSEPKDLADIWGLCFIMKLSITDAITGAQGKAAGIFQADLARVLLSATRQDWELIRWNQPPDPDQFLNQLHELGERLILPT